MLTQYRITVKGHLNRHWAAWFEGLTVSNKANGEAVLEGLLADQTALHGVLIKVRDLGLPLLSVTMVAANDVQTNERIGKE